MKCRAFSFKNPASPHDRLPGIILPEGSDKFDKFQRRQGSGALPLRGVVSLRESAYPATIRDAGRVMAPRKAAKTRRVRGPALLAGDAAHQTPPFAGQGMCSGLRDAVNLAWKLAAVVKENAPDSLLDSYQPEREPNLRATIQMAIMMGRMVCTTSKWSAFWRDTKFRLARALGKLPAGPPGYPHLSSGIILSGAVAAGDYFPQFLANDQKLDDVLGNSSLVLARGGVGNTALAPFQAAIDHWLAKHNTEAVLLRPDHYIFGTGNAAELEAAWHQHITT